MTVAVVIGGSIALLPLLMAWGFHKNMVSAYVSYIVLAVAAIPQQLGDFPAYPIASSLALIFELSLVYLVAYTLVKLFPHFYRLLTQRNAKGNVLSL